MSQFTFTEPTLRLPPGHEQGIKQVQVGCGPLHIRPEWWNTDIRNFDGVDQVMDATGPWPWVDTLNFVYAEHFIEHVPIENALAFLVNAGNALRVGGRIRLSTPCLEWVLKSHFSFEPETLQNRLRDTFFINRAFHGWGHQFLYSKEMLYELLKQAGYQRIKFCEYGQSKVPGLRDLEKHPTGGVSFGYPDVWIVEGERGAAPLKMSAWAQEWLKNSYTRWSHQKH